jgi:hypothetical protein
MLQQRKLNTSVDFKTTEFSGLDKYVMIVFTIVRSTQCIFTILKTIFVILIHLFPLSLKINYLFSTIIILLYSECCIVGILYYWAFSE